MKLLEDRIRRDGKVYAGDVLKVDSFLNHQIDVAFLCEVGKEFYRLYKDCGVNKVLTVEACKERKELKEMAHLTDQQLVESFERRLEQLTAEELPIFPQAQKQVDGF